MRRMSTCLTSHLLHLLALDLFTGRHGKDTGRESRCTGRGKHISSCCNLNTGHHHFFRLENWVVVDPNFSEAIYYYFQNIIFQILKIMIFFPAYPKLC